MFRWALGLCVRPVAVAAGIIRRELDEQPLDNRMKLNLPSAIRLLCAALVAGVVPSINAELFQYSVTLDGASESSPNLSPGAGSGIVNYDDLARTLFISVSFSGLTGTTTASHIHAATTVAGTSTAGVATTTPTFAGFPLGVTSGTYVNTLDLTLASSYNPAYVTANGGTPAAAEAALAGAIAAGKAYFNIHTSTFGGGEIRGFLVPVPVPEPTSLALLCLGSGLVWISRRRRG